MTNRIRLFLLVLWGFVAQGAAYERAHACDLNSDELANANAIRLLEASTQCSEEERTPDAVFYLIIAQIRATTDLSILEPKSRKYEEAVAQMGGALFYSFGGAGPTAMYRDKQVFENLIARLKAAQVKFSASYDPGWEYKKSSKTDVYDQVARVQMTHRLWQLQNFALKIQNDEYYEIYSRLEDLRRENKSTFTKGTPAFDMHERLSKDLEAVSKTIPELPEPHLDYPYDRLNEPSPDQTFTEVFQGYDGPEESEADYFTSEDDLRSSWVAGALSDDQLTELFKAVDFKHQVLVGLAFGERRNVSGDIIMSQVILDDERFSVAGRVGVADEPCPGIPKLSTPFVLAVTERGERQIGSFQSESKLASNFPDECVD